MQLYALDEDKLLLAGDAAKGKVYRCPECNGSVRVRGGPSRQIHFYHPVLPAKCRQHEKSDEHLHLQWRLLELFGRSDAQIECPFPSIGRIADVVWHAKKTIFEIQCSPISLEEAQCRVLDYNLAGYEIIWILHDKQFNKKNLSAAEHFLRAVPCYFTNIDKAGLGVVYDQFEVIKNYKRMFKGPPLTVSLEKFSKLPLISFTGTSLPQIAKGRINNWKCYREGDLLHRLLKEGNLSHAVKKMLEIENQISVGKKAQRLPLKQLITRSYSQLLDYMLKKFSKK